MDPSLLSPSVTPRAPGDAPRRSYSVGATFWTAFFGGPVAGVLMHGLNSRLFGRWERDRGLLASALIFALIVPAVATIWALRPELAPFAPELLGNRSTTRYVIRGFGLLLWGTLHLRLRAEYRAAQMHGDHQSGWKAGIACALAGMLVSVVVAYLVSQAFAR